ncbi:kita-kyushu lung cancer antigen 1 homolog [Callithrix jacchus]|uniref:Cancer/testis antigen 83 n=1 Tax=Callithrix jacchus TaxID=9483 RepID=A0A5F4W088_CALJA|nr:kita-kyushu lung cancer antigen 1 homolog [Callithrix jacchus]
MYVFLLLGSGIVVCALMFVFWKNRFQRNTNRISTGEMSSNSTALALVRPPSTRLINSNTENRLSVNSLSRDVLNTSPHSMAMQKQILFCLNMVEYKLAEVERILVSQRVRRGASHHRKST